MRIRSLVALGAAVGLGILASCTEPAGPTEGTLLITLATPDGGDGAMLFTLSGGPVDSVESVGYSIYSARTDNNNTVRVIVTGTLASGPLARVHIPDQRQISGYLAIVNQVAAHTTYQQRDPSGYSLTVSP
jgi:hypothetical protein